MQSGVIVVKRSGKEESFNFEKIRKVVDFCAQGLDIDLDKFWDKFQLSLKQRLTTREIQRNLIQTAISLVATDENKTNWSTFANRLLLLDFEKDLRLRRPGSNIHGLYQTAEEFWKHVTSLVEKGIYHPAFLEIPKEIVAQLYEELIVPIDIPNHPLWNTRHMQLQKFISTYLVEQDGVPVEHPVEVWFLQSLLGFLPSVQAYEASWEEYTEKVVRHFQYLSKFLIVPATPQLLNLRRAKANLSSCFILDVHDTTESIVHTQSQIAQISRNAGGVGLYLGRLRPSGSWIKGNPGRANKITDWVKIYEATVNAFNQQGKRKGALTAALPVWHKDIIEFLEVIDLDIGEIPKKSPDVFTQVVIPNFFFDYVNKKKPFYLIDLYEVTEVLGRKDLDLIPVWGEEAARRYAEIYRLAEEGKLKNVKKVNPREILRKIFYYWGRKGLPYIFFEDNANGDYSPYKTKILSGNLCVESISPFRNTNPSDLYCIRDDELGKIHTCNITNVNLYELYKQGILQDDSLLQKFVEHLYEYMDNLIDLTWVPVKESETHNRYYRTVTTGFLGLADVFVAESRRQGKYIGYCPTRRRGKREETLQLVDEIFGRFRQFAEQASFKLGVERGFPEGVKELKGSPRRNTLLMTCPPNTSTSIYAGVSAGILPPFNLVQVEDQQTGLFVNFVPEYEHKWFYDRYSAFTDLSDYLDLIEIVAQIQRYIDSAISFEIVVNHNYFEGENLTKLFATILRESRKKGIKTLYYWRHILKDKTVEIETCESCAN